MKLNECCSGRLSNSLLVWIDSLENKFKSKDRLHIICNELRLKLILMRTVFIFRSTTYWIFWGYILRPIPYWWLSFFLLITSWIKTTRNWVLYFCNYANFSTSVLVSLFRAWKTSVISTKSSLYPEDQKNSLQRKLSSQSFVI